LADLLQWDVPMKIRQQLIHSKLTMCLSCHLIVHMFHERNTDPRKGAWQCPNCGRRYPFSHWKIRQDVRGKSKVA
jgi:hypothetical protein